eukprot:gene649-1195_t
MGATEKRVASPQERGTKRPKPEESTETGGATGSDEPPPPLFEKGTECGYTLDKESGFYMYQDAQWMFNEGDNMYVHLASGSVWTLDEAGKPTKMVTDLPELDQKQEERVTGVITDFKPKKKFGFIQLVSQDGDLFVHQNQVIDGTVLEQGMEVSFVISEQEDGRKAATQVQVVGGSGGATGSGEAPAEEGAEVAGGEDEEDDDDDCEEEEDVDLDLCKDAVDYVVTQKGPEKIQIEDRCLEKTRIPVGLTGDDDGTALLFGVFDGHGGEKAAEYMHAHLPTNYISCMRQRKKNASNIDAIKQSFTKSFRLTEHNFLQSARKTMDNSGTTACCAMLYGPDEDGALKLITAHCGDTRAVLSRKGKAFQLTDDHKPNDPAEKRRITAAGGSVTEMMGIWRVVQHLRRPTNGVPAGIMGLAKIVSPDPDITVYDVDFEDDEYIVICSDGIYDELTNQEVIDFSRPFVKDDPEKAAQVLVDMAVKRGGMDDKTVQIVKLGWCAVPDGLEPDRALRILDDAGGDKVAAKNATKKSVVEDSDDDDDEQLVGEEEGPSFEISGSAKPKGKIFDDDDDMFGAAPEKKDDDPAEKGPSFDDMFS